RPETGQRTLAFPGGGFNNTKRRLLGRRDGDAVGLQDAGLLGRDGLERRPEVLRVVERDVRDHLDTEVENVRRIEASTETNLADQQVEACTREVVERGAGQDLELRRWAELGR